VENFAREAFGLGHSSEIVSTALYCQGDDEIILQRLNEFVRTTFLPPAGAFTPWHGLVRRQLARSIEGADIVHIHTLWNTMNLVVRQECARLCRPYVLMPHGMLDPYSLSVKRWRKALYLWAVERKNIRSAQRLIYTTDEEARLAANAISPLPNGVVIPLGGDAPAGNSLALASAFLDRFPKARDRRQLLFLGRLHFKKGLDRILTALPAILRACPDVLLTVVGDGDREYETALKKRISAEGLQESVLFTGRLHGDEKWGAFASAELFLLPSRQENFAITVAEAMHMGLPVIISDKVNTWPYVEAAGAGVVLGLERIASELGDKVLVLLQDCRTRTLMRERGRQYARLNLTWAGAGHKLLNVYEEVLAGRRSPTPN
jgi:glycosyltransferase involved in cell wall biosynthesis